MDAEGRIITLELKHFFVTQVYTPNAGEGLNRLDERQMLFRRFTNEERQGFTNLLIKGFIDTFRYLHGDATGMYTWWSSVSKQAKRTIQAGELTIS
jgi:exodeoxyribonuclease-3